jgi:hypothetical protein
MQARIMVFSAGLLPHNGPGKAEVLQHLGRAIASLPYRVGCKPVFFVAANLLMSFN